MTRPSDPSLSSNALLEKARHTLQSLQYHERAARFKAAAASLQAAMVHAENGQPEQLLHWLERESSSLDAELDWLELDRPESSPETHTPARSIRVDQPAIAITVNEVDSPHKTHVSPWAKMEKAAEARLATQPATHLHDTGESLFAAEHQEVDQDEPVISTELRLALQEVPLGVNRTSGKSCWLATHVWVSLIVHCLLIVCLSLFAIAIAKDPQLLAIVSSPFDSENVLLESPMEMISELEVTAESTPSLPAINIGELSSEVAIDSPAINIESSAAAQTPLSSAVLEEANESSKASKLGSQMLAGAEFFGVKATGNTFVYIVDSSPSMRRGGAFEAARKEIVRSLQSMKAKQRYFVSFFGKEIDPMVFEAGVVERFPVYAKPENLAKTIDWLGRVQVQKEGLPPNNALTEAIAMQPDGIFLLFDGDTKVDVAKFLRRANRSDDVLSVGMPKVPVHVIHFYQEEFQAQMKRVADENGGTYRFVPSPERSSKSNR